MTQYILLNVIVIRDATGDGVESLKADAATGKLYAQTVPAAGYVHIDPGQSFNCRSRTRGLWRIHSGGKLHRALVAVFSTLKVFRPELQGMDENAK